MFLSASVGEKGAAYVPFAKLIDRSGFVDPLKFLNGAYINSN